jgi:hypothetical protein
MNYSETHPFRIERRQLSSRPGLLPAASAEHRYASASLAVAVAVKSVKDPEQEEVRVVHVPTGEIVFHTAMHGGRTH